VVLNSRRDVMSATWMEMAKKDSFKMLLTHEDIAPGQTPGEDRAAVGCIRSIKSRGGGEAARAGKSMRWPSGSTTTWRRCSGDEDGDASSSAGIFDLADDQMEIGWASMAKRALARRRYSRRSDGGADAVAVGRSDQGEGR